MVTRRNAQRVEGEAFFADNPLGLAAFEALADLVADCGGAELRVAATQVGWARRRGFLTMWDARHWLGERGAAVVLSVALPTPDNASDWKQTVEVRPGLWQHHREIHHIEELADDALRHAIRVAYAASG